MDLVVRVPRHPEAGETLFGSSFGTYVGGKGLNQAVAAKRSGAGHVTMIGRIGEDDFGRELRAFLAAEGVDTSFLGEDKIAGTGIAVPLVYNDGGNSILSVPRANLTMKAADVLAARPAFEQADVLLVQFEVTTEAIVAAVELAIETGTMVILNTAPSTPFPGGLEGRADIVVANEHEAKVLAPGGRNPAEQARALLTGRTSIGIVTLGDEGLVLANAGGVERHHAFPVSAVDTVGAGDAFCGALAVAVGGGMPISEAVLFASAAGALATLTPGAAPSLPTREDILRLIMT